MAGWHGWRKGLTVTHIGHLPGRKQVALYSTNEATAKIRVLAWFKTEALAAEALEELDKLIFIRHYDHSHSKEVSNG